LNRYFDKFNLNRRGFIKSAGIYAGCSMLPLSFELDDGFRILDLTEASATELGQTGVRIAEYYKKHEAKEIECELCPRKCLVGDKERGYCGVRENIDGEYYTLVYGTPCSANIDPIEKKPLFHYLPGTSAFSIATAGCNMNCKFCQNWQISQFRPEQINSMNLLPREVATASVDYQCRSIAYTYSEPTIFYEYMRDCAIEGNTRSIDSVMISAGYIEKKPLDDLLPHLKAIKVDLKSFREDYYKDVCSAELKPVLDTLVTIKKSDVWLEIVYLMVPTLNDSPEELNDLCKWVIAKLGPDVPIHFTKFHPQYLLKNLPATPVASLERAYEIAKSYGINYPYVGNVYGHHGESTYCPGCGEKIISRHGYQILGNFIDSNNCEFCGRHIPGVWM